MRWIYLSPHLDDAVLSAGGLIFEQSRTGIPVEIWTLMCGYPPCTEADVSSFAQLLHAQWGFSGAEETIRQRREEDRQAARILGADIVHFDFLDCIYRRGSDGQWLYSDVFIPPHPEDSSIPGRIAAAVAARLEPDDLVVCQLSVGSHVDHVLVRAGAELLGRSLYYDVDLPYIFYYPGEFEQKAAGMREAVQFVTETGLQHWQDAALEYKSQISGLGEAFNEPDRVRASLHAYWAERGGIRILQSD